MITGNKGEWSEVYVLLKLLGDKQVFAGDGDLNKIVGLLFPIIQILKKESNGTYNFEYAKNIVVVSQSEVKYRIPIVQFQEQSKILLDAIKEAQGSSFNVPIVEEFLRSFGSHSLKANSSTKSDIQLVVHDLRTGTTPLLGFSIKSQLGGASTLLNAGKTTNFVYRITDINLDSNALQSVNSIEGRSKIKDRLKKVFELGGRLQFDRVFDTTFNNNLLLIDSLLPQILSTLVLYHYTSEHSSFVKLVTEMEKENPLHFDFRQGHPYYKYKIKRFLSEVALGMVPSKVWDGNLDATGGYLIVKDDGEVLCYHIYNKNDFENYLLNNTKMETASSTRHDFGTLYYENGKLFVNLNLQIRFIK